MTKKISGFYCPVGTSFSDQFPCEPGTFNNKSGAFAKLQCINCLGSYYCPDFATVQPELKCSAGYKNVQIISTFYQLIML